MRQALVALAGLAAGFAAVASQPASAQQGWWSDPMNQRQMDVIEGYGASPEAAPVPRTMVSFPEQYPPGTIVISTSERRLYFVTARGEAVEYGVGVGRPGFEWSGVQKVSAKKEWPAWTPPAEMLKRRPDLPKYMSGGPDNPLGARAMYLGSSLYRIHGSNEPDTIGQAVSSGCIRMTNEDVVDLYDRVKVGARVVVLD